VTDQLLSWLLSVFGALLSFLAIFVGLETFFIQNWLSKADNARAAFKSINGLCRPFQADDQKTLSNGQDEIEQAFNSFPDYTVLLLTIVSLTANSVAIVFYWDTSTSVGTVTIFWVGLIVPVLLALFVVAFASYSYFLKYCFGKWIPLIKEYSENPQYKHLSDVHLNNAP